ncbi:MAG: B12-binding domain-containing radical SAM protein [Clostridia bacterium]|jgi:radical SAM superfamily enzyme YgiQ (UPF0313 family)
MRTLITSLNSKYIHSCLAAWYLKSYCGNNCGEIDVFEATVNEPLDNILRAIYAKKPDVAAFPCYIWNIEYVYKLCENIKKVLPQTVIVLGGPEVSYDSPEVLKANKNIDYIIGGEGEIAFRNLIEGLSKEEKPDESYIKGIAVSNPDNIPSPYSSQMLESTKNKILYFESQRGCPFNCSYCLSSVSEGVRYFSLDRVKRDLKKLIDEKTEQIKFVDRTFNCNKERAKDIFKYIIENNKESRFHFEVAADLFDDEMFYILKDAPIGLIQLEIGIQTLNETVLDLIKRKTDSKAVLANIKKLLELKNIHIHVDLIAGLPEEDFKSFENSFNSVYNLKPHMLQLGFLKMLKGTSIRSEAKKYDYKYKSFPPYEVLSNSSVSFSEISILKEIEELVERFYNSGRFVLSTNYIIDNYFSSPFEFYMSLRNYMLQQEFYKKAVPVKTLYAMLMEFVKTIDVADIELVNELLKIDFLSSDKSGRLPECITGNTEKDLNQCSFDFLNNQEKVSEYLPEVLGIKAKEAIKYLHFERFNHKLDEMTGKYEKEENVTIFNYRDRNFVTGLYNSVLINIREFRK